MLVFLALTIYSIVTNHKTKSKNDFNEELKITEILANKNKLIDNTDKSIDEVVDNFKITDYKSHYETLQKATRLALKYSPYYKGDTKMVEVTDISISKNELCPNGNIRLFWSGDNGWGQYDLTVESNNDGLNPDYKLKISGESEHMDTNTDKKFIKELLMSLVDSIEIVG